MVFHLRQQILVYYNISVFYYGENIFSWRIYIIMVIGAMIKWLPLKMVGYAIYGITCNTPSLVPRLNLENS